ncbi:hypothetical protein NDU88_004015 [Pleurodeles waltl]|uniref:Uncharacterized protein n=1 Tax=Pleurodeles waltl TaxID=8319 RepID=A0AAV7T6C3_PLEWA|nr:hypothetical protein NDU88_004015 [Pleurodeles waltl]
MVHRCCQHKRKTCGAELGQKVCQAPAQGATWASRGALYGAGYGAPMAKVLQAPGKPGGSVLLARRHVADLAEPDCLGSLQVDTRRGGMDSRGTQNVTVQN